MNIDRLRHYLLQMILLPVFGRFRVYWDLRYRLGGTSAGRYHAESAQFKAEVVNDFVKQNQIESVAEFGCGDGRQLSLAKYPFYLGMDTSKAAIGKCRDQFKNDSTKSFLWYDPKLMTNISKFFSANLTISLDVIYHLFLDQIYDKYLDDLFSTSSRFVIVYSSDKDEDTRMPHVRHRHFTQDVKERYPDFHLIRTIKNPHPEITFSDFFVFERTTKKSADRVVITRHDESGAG